MVSHLALHHIFLLLMQCEILHTCAIPYPFFKSTKELVNCSWLPIEDGFVQSVLNFFCSCISFIVKKNLIWLSGDYKQ